MVIILHIKNIYYPVIAAFGIPANLLAIIILSRGNCGLSKCISVYMIAMATADFLVIFFNVIVYHILSYHFPNSFLSYTLVCKFILCVNPATLDMSVWFTVFFTIDRFVTMCCQKFKSSYCTVRTATFIMITFSALISLQNIPFWFAYDPEQIIFNTLWGCQSNVAFYASAAGQAYSWVKSILAAWLPFCLILLFNSLTIRRILVASRARKQLRGLSNENSTDPEMKSRRKSIVLLFSISSSFLLLWLTAIVNFLTSKLTTTVYYRGDYTAPTYIATETGYILMYLSSCTNTCIYAATQTKFRGEMEKMIKYPFILILTLFQKSI
ncbi:probable G-protein coupled receptor 139 [Stegostoma tigrinum]|uniref:probable G-protein coupled receptor 139 n=1 Tax=Stegostoma tigrinum TaxID=3053191 RepID=UPI00202B97EF|nr:probable G-protein coupled receptor 139 [Stegostoma tigrinum]